MYTHFLADNVGIGTTDPGEKLDVKGHVRFYDATYPESYALFENNLITLNERRNRNKLWISAYDQNYGNLIYTEDPQEGSGQGFGIAGGSWMAPFDRFVVNTDEMFLGYSILPGTGGPSVGGDGTGNLYVHGNIGIGTTTPQNKLDVEGAVAIGTDYSGTATAPADGMIVEGNVGIGTTNPGYNLHVIGSTRLENPVDNPGPAALYAFQDSDIAGAGTFVILSSGNPAPVLTANTLGIGPILDLQKNGGTKVRVTNDGNVGIGTENPQSNLQVEGNPGYLQIDSYNGTPLASDCDSNDERGRMILDFANNRLYVCNGAVRGWDYLELTN
jgi:hypothetical protein